MLFYYYPNKINNISFFIFVFLFLEGKMKKKNFFFSGVKLFFGYIVGHNKKKGKKGKFSVFRKIFI